ncbi:MAG: YjfI family protein [Comamonas sp.]|jgi:uncharacterized protein YjfI (DUF2170 family)|uniref:YjfI family protein n=1 Tax=Comamonas sp. TaxID=34028 RepID=UPI00283A2D0D|nr:YjfI family protein [Comamonas sp.]MDR0216538.1 YjfI family protein [Comamonas sp.]
MEHKTSAHYQRLHRQRLREQGLVKKEVWILPEHGPLLQRLEKQMRLPQALPDSLLIDHKEGSMDSASHAYSNIHSLADDLLQSALARDDKLHVEVLEGADASVLVTLPEFGDLPVHLALSGEQLVVEAFLWPADQVKDRAVLNEQILRLQKLFPSTTMALEPLAHGGEGYVMFAALKASSSCEDIVGEILTLSDSVIQATEALQAHLWLAQA